MLENIKKHGLFVGMLIVMVVAFILTWIIPQGSFGSSAFEVASVSRLGFNDIAWVLYYGVYFGIDKIIMLAVIGGFYGVLLSTDAYDTFTTNIANALSKHKKLSIVLISVIVAVATSVLSQTFVVLLFIPFLVSVLRKMGLDNISVMCTTIGSMLVGIMGATFGTEGLGLFNDYMAVEDTSLLMSILVRFGILAIGLILFNFFSLNHLKHQNTDEIKEVKKESKKEVKEEHKAYVPKKVARKNNRKGYTGIIVVGIILLAIAVLGYFPWSNVGIELFDNINTTITSVNIETFNGGSMAIFDSILGSSFGAFGTWDLFNMIVIVALLTVVIGLIYKVKLGDFIDNYGKGMKKAIKPMLCVVAAYMLMVIVYMSPYVVTIVNKILSLTDGFNAATMSLSALIMNIFHTDLGFTAYNLNYYGYFTTEFANYINPLYVIFVSLYGFVQFFMPTSIVLGCGLTTIGVKYKDWLKYIWRFLLGMIICLLIIFILITIL